MDTRSFALILLLILFLPVAGLLSAPVQAQAAFDCSTVTEIPQAECEALVALYNATDGPNWAENTGWLEAEAPCTWYGVRCEDGAVKELSLRENQLRGPIPAEIGNFTTLTALFLSGNHLTDPIPSEIGQLVALRDLRLPSNQLSGPIPPEIGNLTALTVLALWDNQLSGAIPPEIGNLAALERLALSKNQLSGPIPPEIGNLTALESLYLDANQLSGELPVALAQLTALQKFTFDEPEMRVPPGGPVPAWLGGFGHPSGAAPDGDTRSKIQEMLPCLGSSLILLVVLGFLVFLWTEKWRRPKSAPYDSETLPRGIVVQETRTGLVITYRTPTLMRLVALAFLAMISFAFVQEIALGQYFAESRYGILLIPLIFLSVCVVLVCIFNSTTFQIGGDFLTVRHRPIPMPGHRQVPLREIAQIYCRERVRRSYRTGRRSYSYALYAIMRDSGDNVHLFTFKKAAQARYIERQLERHLGIQDAPVLEEFPK